MCWLRWGIHPAESKDTASYEYKYTERWNKAGTESSETSLICQERFAFAD